MVTTLTDHGLRRRTASVAKEALPARLAPGLVMDDFMLLNRIGEGAMGAVFVAQQQSLGRRVAVKVLAPGMTSSAEQIQRFRREIQNLARLQHPNIVTAFYAGVNETLHYVAMTYVEGEDLHHRLQRRGPLSEVEALSVLYKVGDALRYAWEAHGLIHRDIKPANIMLDATGDVKLTDLGISRLVYEEDVEAQVSHIFGTPHYMSPEQVRGELDLDFRSDMYALGMTFYHMCCGYPPFDSDDVEYILECQRSSPLPPIEEDAPQLSLRSRQILQRLTAKHPGDRYDSWDALLTAVQTALDAQPPVLLKMDSQSVAAIDRPRPSTRRAWARRWGGLVLGVAVLGVGGEALRQPDEAWTAAWRRYGVQARTHLAQAISHGVENTTSGLQHSRVWLAARLDHWQAQRRTKMEQQRVAEVIAHLDARAQEYLQAGQPERAAAVYTEYDGPWAEASFAVRRERAEAFFSRSRPAASDTPSSAPDESLPDRPPVERGI